MKRETPHSAFFPEIWSKKLVDKFYDSTVLGKFYIPDHLLRRKTRLIMDLKIKGLSDDEILVKIIEDKDNSVKIYPRKICEAKKWIKINKPDPLAILKIGTGS